MKNKIFKIYLKIFSIIFILIGIIIALILLMGIMHTGLKWNYILGYLIILILFIGLALLNNYFKKKL